MTKRVTGTIKFGATVTRLGHILAHISNQGDRFSSYDYLTQAEMKARESILGIHGTSEEFDIQECKAIYELPENYSIRYPSKGNAFDENLERWKMAFTVLIRDAAVTHTLLAARIGDDEGLEHASFAIDLWDIHAELRRGLGIEELHRQMEMVLENEL